MKTKAGVKFMLNGAPVFVVQFHCEACDTRDTACVELNSRDTHVAVWLCRKCLKHLGNIFDHLPSEGSEG